MRNERFEMSPLRLVASLPKRCPLPIGLRECPEIGSVLPSGHHKLASRFCRTPSPPLSHKAVRHLCAPGNASDVWFSDCSEYGRNSSPQDWRPHKATIITPANVTIDPAADGALVAAAFTSHECAYCLSPIVSEQRWVREKIYEPSTGNGPRYRRYHADLFADEELSCWEKRVMELEIARTARTAVRVM